MNDFIESITYPDIEGKMKQMAKREQQETGLLGEAVKTLAERQINVIGVSCSAGEPSEVWAVVEYSIGNGKWSKFCIKNNYKYGSDFLKHIVEVVSIARDSMKIKY